MYTYLHGLPWWLSGKESTCDAGDTGDPGLIPGSGRSPGGGRGNPLQYSCLENATDRGAWQTTVHGVAKSLTQLKRLSMHAYIHISFFRLFSIKIYYRILNIVPVLYCRILFVYFIYTVSPLHTYEFCSKNIHKSNLFQQIVSQ